MTRIAFPRPDPDRSREALESRPNDLVYLTTAKGLRIPAIYVKNKSATSKFTIIYSHGNAEDIGLSLPYLDLMSGLLDVSVFAYEYPGYSLSEGEPSEEGVYDAINAAYRHLTDVLDIDHGDLVAFGRSIGTGPSVDLCSRMPRIAGCVLQSPLESGMRVIETAGHCMSFGLYPIDIFRSYQKVEAIRCPVLVMHGEEDTVVPVDNGKALYERLKSRPWHEGVAYEPLWFPGAGHNDMPEILCLQHCRRFLAFLRGRSIAQKAAASGANPNPPNPNPTPAPTEGKGLAVMGLDGCLDMGKNGCGSAPTTEKAAASSKEQAYGCLDTDMGDIGCGSAPCGSEGPPPSSAKQ